MADNDESNEPEAGIEAIQSYLSRSPVLERVVEVNQALPGPDGRRVLVTSAELWGSIVVFHEVITPGMSIARGDSAARLDRSRRMAENALRDDLGNTYPWAGGGGGLLDGLVDANSPLKLDLWQDRTAFRGPLNGGASFLFYRSANAVAGECAVEIGIVATKAGEHFRDPPRLVRVVTVNQTLPARGGGRVIVAAVELWSSLIVFNVNVAGSEGRLADVDDVGAQYRFSSVLRDDLGNTYQRAGGGGGGGGDPVMQFTYNSAAFHGPVHPDASALLFRPTETEKPEELRIPI